MELLWLAALTPALLGLYLLCWGGSRLVAERDRIAGSRVVPIRLRRAEVARVAIPTAVATMELRWFPRMEYFYRVDGPERLADVVNPDPQSAWAEDPAAVERFIEQVRRRQTGFFDAQAGQAFLQRELSPLRRRMFTNLSVVGVVLQVVGVGMALGGMG